ncbi:MAG: hypothetical protein FWH18_02675 [Marinilabiliaceae bacterium]|nr:hypothetical protein [Marinilabiliaceae bacterium]
MELDFENNVDISSPFFDFSTNYADKIETNSNELAGYHIGYVFYAIYHKTCLSLHDMLEIEDINMKIITHITFKKVHH